jgi:DMSO/TMAO reductase YedYZ molybdopterin-dependent catalytic subunit
MLLVQAFARLAFGVQMFPDLFEDAFTRALPTAVFGKILDTFQFGAKPLLFVGVLIVQVLLGAALGAIVARRGDGLRIDDEDRWRDASVEALVLWLIVALLVLPLTGNGLLGVATAPSVLALNLVLIVGFAVYTLGSAALLRRFLAAVPVEAPANVDADRRRVLGGIATGVASAVAVGVAYRVASLPITSPSVTRQAPAPPLAASPAATAPPPIPSTIANADQPLPPPPTPAPEWKIPGLAPEITPLKDFYVVSKNFFSDPVVNPETWTLDVGGAVKQPYRLTYSQLVKLPWEERYQNLACISNEVGGDLISNASWRGVLLHDLLAAAGPSSAAIKVKFSAADGYTDSIPIARALSPANLLAYQMDGEALKPEHGAPARLLIPGIYGMKNVKWLTGIELVTDDFQGYWEQRGWSDVATIQTMSRIDVPAVKDTTIKAGKAELAGVAFAGDRGIAKVEVSVDGGKTWATAILKEALAPLSWRLWRLDWDAQPGTYQAIVRATDGTGKTQPSDMTDTLPDGATGWHSIQIKVT